MPGLKEKRPLNVISQTFVEKGFSLWTVDFFPLVWSSVAYFLMSRIKDVLRSPCQDSCATGWIIGEQPTHWVGAIHKTSQFILLLFKSHPKFFNYKFGPKLILQAKRKKFQQFHPPRACMDIPRWLSAIEGLLPRSSPRPARSASSQVCTDRRKQGETCIASQAIKKGCWLLCLSKGG